MVEGRKISRKGRKSYGKSPLAPLSQREVILGASLRAESLRLPFGNLFPVKGRQREVGGIL